MIPLNAIKDDLQSRLNKAGTLQFILHTHTGKFVRAVKASVNEIDRKINGLVTLTSSDVETVQTGIDVASMTLKIDFVIRCKDDEDDVYDITVNGEQGDLLESGNVSYVNQVYNALNDFASKQYTGLLQAEGNGNYAIACSFDLVNDGVRDKRPTIGDSYTFTVFAYYNIVENGENSKDIEYFLDGYVIPYTSAKIGRQPIAESDVYSGENVAKATSTATLMYCSLTAPSFYGKFADYVRDFVLGDSNDVHILTYRCAIPSSNGYEDYFKSFFVVFGDSSLSAEGVANVGSVVSFSETHLDDNSSFLSSGVQKYDIKQGEKVTITKSRGELTVIYYGGSVSISSYRNSDYADDNKFFNNDLFLNDTYIITNGAVTITR